MRHVSYPKASAVVAVTAALLLFPSIGGAQEDTPGGGNAKQLPPTSPRHDHPDQESTEQTQAEQLRKLQQQVAELEAVLKQRHAGQSEAGTGGTMSGTGGMEMGGGKMKGMSGMGGMDMGGGKMKGMSGMGMMGQQPGMGQMSMPSALPGYPGASHIYHIGTSGFFLDHLQRVTLSAEQQTQLNEIKSDALLKTDEFDRSIQAAEQQLWTLTSSDSPSIAKIDAVVREIAKLRGDQRIAFIRSVGEAAGVLTAEQRKVLAGHPPADHADSGTAAKSQAADAHQH